MTETELEGVIDKLADKLNVAVNELRPIAQEVLDQYVTRATMFIIMWASFLIVFAVTAVYAVKRGFKEQKIEYTNRDEGILVMCVSLTSLGFIMVLISISQLCSFASQMLAPLVSILGL